MADAGETKSPESKIGEKKEKIKRPRGRPRKKEKAKEQAGQMRSYLENCNCGFQAAFGTRRRIEHSPVNGKEGDSGKIHEEGKVDDERNRGRKEKNEEEDEVVEELSERTKTAGESETGTTAAGTTATVEGKETTVPTEAEIPAGDKKREDAGKVSTEDATGTGAESTTEELAVVRKLIKDLENKIDRIDREKISLEKEMNEMREKVRLERIINEGLRRDIELVKKERIMDKNRMNELELVIEELLEKGRDTLGKEQNVENNNNNNEEKESVREDGAGEKEEGELDIENSEEENNNNNKGGGLGNIKRDYLKVMPEKLGEEELEWEMVERKNRKKNIFIRGVRTVGARIKEEIKGIIKEKLDEAIYIKKVRAIGGGLIVELESMENKIEVMKKRGMLKGMNVWIEDDLTEREKEIQNWLKMIAEEERGRGLETQIGYQKIKVNGCWYEWSEKKGRIEEAGEGGFRKFRK
ncbi:protein bfr2-like [Nasonia vitripennis]|uniref:Uncharacterized protein n=1 Tax=Nasonia vitripennis TaxID=7425 RepID=A0A7M7Q996_NASVI|nr:protein bfr2-like [Nasonia vitripennis]